MWVVLATQGFLLAAMAFWYGTYLGDSAAYSWTIPGVIAGCSFIMLYARSIRKNGSKQ